MRFGGRVIAAGFDPVDRPVLSSWLMGLSENTGLSAYGRISDGHSQRFSEGVRPQPNVAFLGFSDIATYLALSSFTLPQDRECRSVETESAKNHDLRLINSSIPNCVHNSVHHQKRLSAGKLMRQSTIVSM
jgi:hypothetical protein